MKEAKTRPRLAYLNSMYWRAWQVRFGAFAIFLVCLVTALSGVISDSLSISRVQSANSIMGMSDALINIPGSAPIARDGNALDQKLRSAVANAGGRNIEIDYYAAGLHASDDTETSYVLNEIQEPASIGNRVRLVSGAWPSRLGEATVSASASTTWPIGSHVSFLSGHLSVQIVGVFENRFARNSREFVVAPGTWSSIGGLSKDEAATLGDPAGRNVRWTGEENPDSILAAVRAVLQSESDGAAGATDPASLFVETRAAIESAGQSLSVPLLASMVSSPLVGGLIGGLMAGLFASKIRGTMWTVGVSHKSSRRSAFAAILRMSLISSALGIAAGVGAGLAGRPILDSISSRELGPMTSATLALILLGFPLANLAALGGLFLARARASRNRHVDAGAELDRQIYRISFAVVLASIGIFLGSGTSDISTMTLSAILIASSLAIGSTPWLVRLVSRTSLGTLTFRLGLRRLATNTRSNSLVVSTIAILQILGLSLAILVTSSLDAQNGRESSQVPAGQIVFTPEIADPTAAAKLQAQFEQELGLGPSIPVYTAGAGNTRQDGATRLVPSVQALEEIIGVELSASQVRLLESGGTLLTSPIEGDTVTYPPDGDFPGVTIQARSLNGLDPSFRNIDGFMLKSQAADTGFPVLLPQFVYTGVSPDQAAKAKQAAIDLAFNPNWVHVFKTPDPWEAPLRIWAISGMLSLIAGVTVLLWTTSESRRLRPTLASLRSLGIERRSAVKVVAVSAGVCVLIGIVVAVLASIVAVATSFALARLSVPISLPILPMATGAVALAIFGLVGSWLATRHLRYSEWLQ